MRGISPTGIGGAFRSASIGDYVLGNIGNPAPQLGCCNRTTIRWRVYGLVAALVMGAAIVIRLLARVSFWVAALVAIGGLFVNGMLILLGDVRARRDLGH